MALQIPRRVFSRAKKSVSLKDLLAKAELRKKQQPTTEPMAAEPQPETPPQPETENEWGSLDKEDIEQNEYLNLIRLMKNKQNVEQGMDLEDTLADLKKEESDMEFAQ